MENHHFQWVNPLSMVIFNSYVSPNQRVCIFGVDHPPVLGDQAPPDVFCTLIALELRTRGMAISVRLEGAAAPLQMLSTLARKGNSACAADRLSLGGKTGNAQHYPKWICIITSP